MLNKERLLMTLMSSLLAIGVFAVIFIYTDQFTALHAGIGGKVVKIHYSRADGIYDNWNLWIWAAGSIGEEYRFSEEDEFGMVATISNYEFRNKVGFIVKKTAGDNAWAEYEFSDRFIEIKGDDKFAEIWVTSGDIDFSYDPPRSGKIKNINLNIHYNRYRNDYKDWNLWFWVGDENGKKIEFNSEDEYGKVASISLRDTPSKMKFGFVVRKSEEDNEWAQKDISEDRYIPAAMAKTNGALDVYLLEGDNNIYYRKDDVALKLKLKLPVPVFENHSKWIDLYWASWRFMHAKITRGDATNGFERLYIDEGFNENIYQWDSIFMVAYAIYGLDIFPAMATLDNFYTRQSEDGYICRCYNENTGKETGKNDINPPLFAWMEWRHYKLTGDASRLNEVLPVLDNYFQWVKKNARSEYGNGLYYITNFGSGMDNSPREDFIKKGAWIDLSSQQALAALYLSKLSAAIGNTVLEKKYKKEFNEIKTKINVYLWDKDNRMYYDKKEDGNWHKRNTIASFWPMVAEVTDENKAFELINRHLKNSEEFYRKHLFPTLAANDPVYDKHGNYWRGAVWAPTNFATIKGIAKYDYKFALEASINHVNNISSVYHDFNPLTYKFPIPSVDESNIPRNGHGFNQIWEAYAADETAPATRWDAKNLVRQKFCGWSGIGPVALFIENIIGLDINAPNNTIIWRINFTEEHGLKRFKIGNSKVDLIAGSRAGKNDPIKITGSTGASFKLIVYNYNSQKPVYNDVVKSGEINIDINP